VKAAIKGQAKNFVDVMEVVKENKDCKEVIQNFSDQGYVIDLKNTYVVEEITLDQDIAVVAIEATHVNNPNEYILVTVDLQEKAVVEVITGAKAGCCVGKCCAEQGGSYYYGVCIPAIALCYTPPPNPTACCIAYGCENQWCPM